MKTIKLKLEIDLTNPAIVAAFNTLLSTIGGHGINEQKAVKPIVEDKLKQVKATKVVPLQTTQEPKPASTR